MSAKHIATVKEADKKNKGKGSSKSNALNNNNNARNSKQRGDDEEQQDPPEVVEALASLRKVERIVKENPNMAASVLWKISKGNRSAPHDTYFFICQGSSSLTSYIS